MKQNGNIADIIIRQGYLQSLHQNQLQVPA
jgi:hypothetical protein